MNLSERKFNELSQKLESLTSEFKYWRTQSEAFQPLQKHHSQIRRIISRVEGLQSAIRDELDVLLKDRSSVVLSEARNLERNILEAHRIWEFFRSKFALRSVGWFNPYLIAADELAWASYRIVQENFNYVDFTPEDVKEPPLVFFNGGSSPYTLPRDLAFQAEEVADEELRSPESSEILRELPIPLIGIPWFQVRHLPDVLVIGHEAGHAVEEDFRLTTRIESLLANATRIDEVNRPAWKMWSREIFADLYGNLMTGPAFVGSLMDFLAPDKTSVETDRRAGPRWGPYPPDYLRILINLEALQVQGLNDDAARLQQELKSNYSAHAMKHFEDDIKHVVHALLNEPYPEFKDRPLIEIVRFSPTHQANAQTASQKLLNGHTPETTNIRVVLAAARLAYATDPEMYAAKDAHNLILKCIPAIQKEGVRAPSDVENIRAQLPADLDGFDRSEGGKLLSKLRGSRAAAPPLQTLAE